MGTSVLHIKIEMECRVYLFDEEKGIAKPGTYFNLEVRKGEQDLLFVSTEDETVRCQLFYAVEENDSDYRITVERSQFRQEMIQMAEQGHADAQYRLGLCYEKGEGVEQNLQEAVKWYRKSAEQGHTVAQKKMGWCYMLGKGEAQDSEEAVKWYRRAAEWGGVNAQGN